MFRYWLMICLLLITAAACSPTTSDATEPQPIASEEMSEDQQEADHIDEHDDEHDEAEEHEEHEEHEEDEDHREHGAHEHGAATLTIAWSGNELAIDLETPAFNVVGFEYAPTSEEDKTLLAESVAALEAGELLQLSSGADCTVTSAVVETELSEEAHEEGEEEHEEGEVETHSDIDVAYTVQCQNPDALESLDASGLFIRFPNFEALQVQWISDTQQSATELTSANPIVSFR